MVSSRHRDRGGCSGPGTERRLTQRCTRRRPRPRDRLPLLRSPVSFATPAPRTGALSKERNPTIGIHARHHYS
jgi:hypothetical protein